MTTPDQYSISGRHDVDAASIDVDDWIIEQEAHSESGTVDIEAVLVTSAVRTPSRQIEVLADDRLKTYAPEEKVPVIRAGHWKGA